MLRVQMWGIVLSLHVQTHTHQQHKHKQEVHRLVCVRLSVCLHVPFFILWNRQPFFRDEHVMCTLEWTEHQRVHRVLHHVLLQGQEQSRDQTTCHQSGWLCLAHRHDTRYLKRETSGMITADQEEFRWRDWLQQVTMSDKRTSPIFILK